MNMKRLLDYLWPIVGLIAVVWSVELLYSKLFAEAATDPNVAKILESGGLWSDIKTIALGIGRKLAGIPAHSYILAALSTLAAYFALAWYDRIALLHLGRASGISWTYVACCSAHFILSAPGEASSLSSSNPSSWSIPICQWWPAST